MLMDFLMLTLAIAVGLVVGSFLAGMFTSSSSTTTTASS